MCRKTIQVLAAAICAMIVRPAAAQYAGTVLYPLTTPSGSQTYNYSTLACDTTGQFVGTYNAVSALFWPGSSAAVTLNPGTTGSAQVSAVAGNQQVGQYRTGIGPSGIASNAYLWNGTAASALNLNPAGYASSDALGTNGSQQVGDATTSSVRPATVAFLWKGSAASGVDLNPNSVTNSSEAIGTDGTNQVGYAYIQTDPTGPYDNACLWSGTAASFVNLNPGGHESSEAVAVSGTQEVGSAAPPGTPPYYTLNGSNFHAMLWNGTAASYVDLNPDGYLLSTALGTNGSQQVGSAYLSRTTSSQAFIWSGTADSAVDLQTLLPSNDTWIASAAENIDASGNAFGWAEDSNQNVFAVEWSSVPEPTMGAMLLAIGAGMLLPRRRLQLACCR